jgi:hypothetical protein
MPIGKKFGTMQCNLIGPLLISYRYKKKQVFQKELFLRTPELTTIV